METFLAHVQRFVSHLQFEKRYSPHTVRSYHDDLLQFEGFLGETFGETTVPEVVAPMIRSWLASLKERGITSRSITRKISSVKSFFKYALREGYVTKNPAAAITAPKMARRLPVYVEENHMKTLLNHVEFTGDWKGYTARLAIKLLYELGIRLSELINCRESQFDFSYGHVKILGKGNKERIIPLGSGLRNEIREYVKQKRVQFENPDESFLLVSEKGRRLYAKYVYRITTEYLSQVTSIEKKSPHVLRHSFATHLSNNGAELNAVKELLGHASLASTQVYTHNTIEKLKNVHKKAHPRG
jgi:integrase/recombinase XerC